jgi:GTP cyclohydrolase II
MAKISKGTIANFTKPKTKKIRLIVNNKAKIYRVSRQGIGHLVTRFGVFILYRFFVNDKWQEYNVLFKGKLNGRLEPKLMHKSILHLRVDSGCLTGQVFDDQTCECRGQLRKAMREISEIGEGLIICIPKQDGRGMGIPFKLATLSLQYLYNMDTVEAAEFLAGNHKIDKRDYYGTLAILRFLNITKSTKIGLFTNNPSKISAFTSNGYMITRRLPIIIKPNKFTVKHLKAKQKRLGHVGLISD